MGLLLTLRWFAAGFAERSGISVDLDLPESFERLPVDTETALFRIVQESLINIYRHAGSETARIRLRRPARRTPATPLGDHGRMVISPHKRRPCGGRSTKIATFLTKLQRDFRSVRQRS